MLLKTVQSRKIDPKLLITHRFKLDQILDAYETFGRRGEDACAQGHHRGLIMDSTRWRIPGPRRSRAKVH